jgi:hypothetical protein
MSSVFREFADAVGRLGGRDSDRGCNAGARRPSRSKEGYTPAINPIPILAVLLVGSVTLGLGSRWRSQRRLLARIRDEWGKARIRDRDMTAIASYHRSLAADDSAASLEDRTWDDLNLDAVFALLDRTVSSVGQQVLYRRMRIAPKSNTLETF